MTISTFTGLNSAIKKMIPSNPFGHPSRRAIEKGFTAISNCNVSLSSRESEKAFEAVLTLANDVSNHLDKVKKTGERYRIDNVTKKRDRCLEISWHIRAIRMRSIDQTIEYLTAENRTLEHERSINEMNRNENSGNYCKNINIFEASAASGNLKKQKMRYKQIKKSCGEKYEKLDYERKKLVNEIFNNQQAIAVLTDEKRRLTKGENEISNSIGSCASAPDINEPPPVYSKVAEAGNSAIRARDESKAIIVASSMGASVG